MYGCLHEGRTLHQIATINDETLMIFGGTNLKSFISTVAIMTFSKWLTLAKYIIDEYEVEKYVDKLKDLQSFAEMRSPRSSII